MITISTLADAACKVSTGDATFEVFPATPTKDMWSLLSNPEEVLTDKKNVSWPGEYDFCNMTMRAIGQHDGRQVSYACNSDGIRLAFINGPILEWTDAEIEKLGDIDVLVIGAEEPKRVMNIIEAVDPRVVVLFELKGGDIHGVAKACGVATIQPVKEFKVKPGSLPQDARQVVVLQKD